MKNNKRSIERLQIFGDVSSHQLPGCDDNALKNVRIMQADQNVDFRKKRSEKNLQGALLQLQDEAYDHKEMGNS